MIYEKYPYIPNKKLFAAVMGACSYIRDTGYFNKACEYYADKYGLKVEDVEREVRKRQSVGRKNKYKKVTYQYYAIEYSIGYGEEECFFQKYSNYVAEVKRATCKENAMHQVSNVEDRQIYAYHDWKDVIAYFGRVEEFKTKKEAQECVDKWLEERKTTYE